MGSMLVVPFGPRRLLGVVVDLAEESELPPERLAEPLSALEADVPAPLVRLGLWLAREYCSAPARGLALVLPPGTGTGSGRGRCASAAPCTPASPTPAAPRPGTGGPRLGRAPGCRPRRARRRPAGAWRHSLVRWDAGTARCARSSAAASWPSSRRPTRRGARSSSRSGAAAGRAPEPTPGSERGAGGGRGPNGRRRGGAPAAAPRRHRQRQDGGVPARGGQRARARPLGDRARSRDRAHAPDRRPLRRALRGRRGGRCTRALPHASATTSGGGCGAARRACAWARAPPSSRPSTTSA